MLNKKIHYLLPLFTLAFIIVVSNVYADIYVYVGPNGGRLLTDHSNTNPLYTLIQRITGSSESIPASAKAAEKLTPYDTIIETQADKYNVDTALLKAIIAVESNFDPKATSKRGARGLMQLMPRTAKQYNVFNLYDPSANVKAGAQHLQYLLKKYDNVKLALAAYNAGETIVDKYKNIPPYRETSNYVKKVMKLHKQYATG